MQRKTVAAVWGATLGLATIALAASGFSVKPGVYDPDNTGIIKSSWVAKQGLPDAGKSDHALYLQKAGPTATNAAAYAIVDGVEGIELEELGFDYRDDGHCGAGAPRFNVTTDAGFHFVGGCANGTKTPVGLDARNKSWTRVTFDPQNPAQAFPVIPPGAKVQSISILFDEGTDVGPGYAYIDNIKINDTVIGKPGSVK